MGVDLECTLCWDHFTSRLPLVEMSVRHHRASVCAFGPHNMLTDNICNRAVFLIYFQMQNLQLCLFWVSTSRRWTLLVASSLGLWLYLEIKKLWGFAFDKQQLQKKKIQLLMKLSTHQWSQTKCWLRRSPVSQSDSQLHKSELQWRWLLRLLLADEQKHPTETAWLVSNFCFSLIGP